MSIEHSPTLSVRRGHPMRRRLPAPPRAIASRDDDDDLKLFALSFTAFFICFYTFLM